MEGLVLIGIPSVSNTVGGVVNEPPSSTTAT